MSFSLDLSQIKAIALDLDGTALDPQGKITPALKHILRELEDRGVLTIIATGRALSMIQELIPDLPPHTPYLLNVGSVIHNVPNLHYVKSINQEIARDILQYGLTFPNFKVYATDAESVYGTHQDQWVYAADGNTELEQAFDKDLVKLFFQDLSEEHERVLAIKNYIEEHYNHAIEAVFSSSFTLDVTAKGISKISAMKTLLASQGYSVEDNVLAFGDSFNDASMLYAAKYGFYMANTPDFIKEVYQEKETLFPIGSNAEDGLARALNELFALGYPDDFFSTTVVRDKSKILN